MQVKLHPAVKGLWENWNDYGFESPEQAHEYTGWIKAQSAACYLREEDPGTYGFNGLHTPDQVLERYPLDEFLADKDIREGRVVHFRSLEEALEYLSGLE